MTPHPDKLSPQPSDPPSDGGRAESPSSSVIGAIFYRWDLSRKSMWWARGLSDLIGCEPDGGTSTHEWWAGRIHPDDQKAYAAAVSSILSQGTEMAVEYRAKTEDGEWVHLLDEAVMVGDRDGGSAHVLGSIHDMSRFRNWEQVQQATDLFLTKISHDMRTPLGSIFIWLQLLKHSELNEEERARALTAIENSATMLGEFVEELFDLSRMIAGEVRLQLRPVQLSVVIDAAVEAARPSAQAKGVQVNKSVDPGVGPVAGDSDRLLLLVRALLSNAVAFTPKDGKVNVALTRSDNSAQITVTDDGPGLGTDLDRIIEGFPPASKRSRGVGLHLAHLLALLHGGSLKAQTEGEGNSFTVRMPLLDQDLLARLPAGRAARENLTKPPTP